MKLSQNKAFHAFLKTKGITVKNGAVPIDKAEKIPEMFHKFGIQEAKKAGLPKKLQKHADKVVTIGLSDLERSSQEPAKYDVEIVESEKNYEMETWGGAFKGTVNNLWKWLMEECTENHNQYDFEEALQAGIEEQ